MERVLEMSRVNITTVLIWYCTRIKANQSSLNFEWRWRTVYYIVWNVTVLYILPRQVALLKIPETKVYNNAGQAQGYLHKQTEHNHTECDVSFFIRKFRFITIKWNSLQIGYLTEGDKTQVDQCSACKSHASWHVTISAEYVSTLK